MQHGRAYSTIEFKSVDEDLRIIEGVASTPEVDRMGDIVDPAGAKFALPIPLLWQHRADQPIGHVLAAKVTPDGIQIRAQIAKGILPHIEEAWQLIRAQLVRGLSIGFNALETEPIKGTFGRKFISWEWLELSAVTIPANGSASISLIKALDSEHLTAAHGHQQVNTSGASDITRAGKPAQATKGARSMARTTIAERKMAFAAEKEAKVAKLNELIGADDGTTMDAETQEAFDTLTEEVKSLDAQLARLETVEQINKANLTPVQTAQDAQTSAQVRQGLPVIQVDEKLPPGIEFARTVLCKARSFVEMQKGNMISALDVAKQMYPHNSRIHAYMTHKAAVTGGTTTDTNYAASLLRPAQVLEGEFLEYLRPMTIVGKFGTNGIPSLRRVPFNVKIQSQTTAGSASWVGQGKAKPLTKFHYTDTTLLFTKIAAIAVITEELARFSSPGAEALVRDALADAVIARMDSDFIDPAISESAGVRPASITNGLTALTSAGVSADNARTDIQNLLEQYVLNNVDVAGVVLIMPNTLALALSNMFTTLAQPQFPGLNINGGSLLGIPVITTQYAASGASYGNMVIAVNARDVALADDGQVNVDASREASVEMDDAPTGDATAGTGASVVSMWQTNSIALRAERVINWKKLRNTAVVFMDDVNWGSIGSPV